MEKFLSLDSPLDRIQFMYRQEAYLPMLQVLSVTKPPHAPGIMPFLVFEVAAAVNVFCLYGCFLKHVP